MSSETSAEPHEQEQLPSWLNDAVNQARPEMERLFAQWLDEDLLFSPPGELARRIVSHAEGVYKGLMTTLWRHAISTAEAGTLLRTTEETTDEQGNE